MSLTPARKPSFLDKIEAEEEAAKATLDAVAKAKGRAKKGDSKD